VQELSGQEFFVSKKAGKAIWDYRMIADGDKIAVGVSGGKDSLALLYLLHYRRSFVPVKYGLLAMHVDSGYPRSFSRGLIKHFKEIGVDYHISKIDILKRTRRKDINCFWCSWNRRRALFEEARRLGCNKIALAHHKDDIVETMLLNLFFQGEISTMSPKQELFRGKMTIIRPLAYIEEDEAARFARKLKLPVQECACPQGAVSNRAKVARIIRSLEKVCPEVKTNIFRSLKRIKKEYLP
jgi:tRNA 2-thiocytidine biosynthesis protein TtcA